MKKNSLYDIEYFQKIKNAQQIKKKRTQQKRLFVIIVIFLLIGYLISPLSRINNISVVGNTRFDETQIKKMAEVETGQFTFLKPAYLISKNLKDSKLFNKVDTSKTLFGNTMIKIKENKLLFYTTENKKIVFYDENNNKISFNSKQSKKYIGVVPELSSKVSDEIKKKLVEKLRELDDSVVNEVSQIIHKPKSYEKEYFRFVMSGEKEIYINSSLDHIVKVGGNYHSFASNTKYTCSYIEFIGTESKAIVKKCK